MMTSSGGWLSFVSHLSPSSSLVLIVRHVHIEMNAFRHLTGAQINPLSYNVRISIAISALPIPTKGNFFVKVPTGFVNRKRRGKNSCRIETLSTSGCAASSRCLQVHQFPTCPTAFNLTPITLSRRLQLSSSKIYLIGLFIKKVEGIEAYGDKLVEFVQREAVMFRDERILGFSPSFKSTPPHTKSTKLETSWALLQNSVDGSLIGHQQVVSFTLFFFSPSFPVH